MYQGYEVNQGDPPPQPSGGAAGVGSLKEPGGSPRLYEVGFKMPDQSFGTPQYLDWQVQMQHMNAHMMAPPRTMDLQSAPYVGVRPLPTAKRHEMSPSISSHASSTASLPNVSIQDMFVNAAGRKQGIAAPVAMNSLYMPHPWVQPSIGVDPTIHMAPEILTPKCEWPVMQAPLVFPMQHTLLIADADVQPVYAEPLVSQPSNDMMWSGLLPATTGKPRQTTLKPLGGQKAGFAGEKRHEKDRHHSTKPKTAEEKGAALIQEQFESLLGHMPTDTDAIIAMAKPHINMEPDFFNKLGGIYKDLEDDTVSISVQIEKLQKKLSDLHEAMGRNLLSRQAEPSKSVDSLVHDLILKEMQDFQDLVNYEHREKRRKFKAVILAAQKQANKFQSRKMAQQLEETRQQRLICKNIANVVGLYWKKIERFAWERLKRELQSTLVEKKRMRLDKFVEDAIKMSISKNDRVKRGSKARKLYNQSETNHEKVSIKREREQSSGDDKDYVNHTCAVKAERDNKIKMENVPGIKSEIDFPTKSPVKPAIMKQHDGHSESGKCVAHRKDDAHSTGVVDEDEFVVSEEMKRMERDDALLDMAMEREEEEDQGVNEKANKKRELNALEDDMNVPIEEILKRYQQEAAKFKEEYGSCEESGEDEECSTENGDDDAESVVATSEGSGVEEEEETGSHEDDVHKSREQERSSKVTGGRIPSEDGVADPQSANDGEFTVNDEIFKAQENEDKDLDEEMSDEHSDTESGKQERVKEISALEDEANIPIEELLARYKADGGCDDEDSMSEGSIEGYSSGEEATRSVSSDADTEMDSATVHRESTSVGSDVDMMSGDSSTEDDEQVEVPSLIKATLRPYQIEGLRWLASLYRQKSNGILADEMGLGKTLQTIALLAHLACDHGNWGPHLIVVPTSVLINWEMEFKKFCPGFTILSYYGTPSERAKKRVGWNKQYAFNVCIASYATVVQDAYMMKRKSWVYMILDEAQNIKNFNSKRWQTLLTFNTEGRILLTGTPLQNSLQELWSLMHFILPEIFSSHSEFKEWFSDPLTESIEREQGQMDGKVKDAQTSDLVNKLHMVLRPYLLRRLKKDVEKQMPSKYEHVIKCYLSRRQRVLYDEFISSSSAVEALSNPNYRSMLFVLMQLRKICNHPDQLQSRPVESPYYDPNLMDDVMMPMMVLLPDKRSDAKLYRYEKLHIRRDPPDSLVVTGGSRRNLERLPLPMSFIKGFRGGHVSLDNVFRESTNAYDQNVINLPIVNRILPVKCILDDNSAGKRKGPLAQYLMDEVMSTNPYEPLLNIRYGGRGRSISESEGRHEADDGSMSIDDTLPSARTHGTSVSSITDEDVDMEQVNGDMASEVEQNASHSNASSISQKGDDGEPNHQLEQEEQTSVGADGSSSEGGTQSSTAKTPSKISDDVIVNRRELLEVDDSLFLRKFTIAKRRETNVKLFSSFVRPTVDDLVERNWWLISRFVCTNGQKIECNPRRVFMTGPGGISWQQSQEALLTRVRTTTFRTSSVEYFKNTKYTIEHVRGMQKLLFPPRSLLHDDCGKFLVLGRLLKKLKSEGHRCLLYTQFSKMLDILENWINYMGFTYVRLDGSTKVDMRQRIVTRFNENTKIFLFISSTRAGGVGLTLTGADTVIFYDTDWNPAMDRQAMDRCHRIGQTREVNVYRLVSEHTVEENIWRKQLQKRRLDDIVVDKGNFDSEHHDWFSNVDTLMTILKSHTGEGHGSAGDEEDIYGKKVLHESEAPEPVGQDVHPGSAKKIINLLAEAEDEDDSAALVNRTKETENIDREFQMDFNADLVSTIPSLVAYCIQFMLKYKTPTLMAQKEEMAIKIQAEEYDSAVEDEEEGSESGSGYNSEVDEEENQEDEEGEEEEE